jgi:thiol:disulfide interchange protein DsbA
MHMKFLLALLSFVSLTAVAGPFEAGKHFQELPFPQPVETGTKIELREFFWYGCPHCYMVEPALEHWLKKPPANVQFVRTPGAAPNWILHAQAYYAFESLGALDRLHVPFFKAIHAGKQVFNDEASIARFAAANGVPADKFSEAFRSFSVRTKTERAKKLNAEYQVSFVPMFVVDGKYATSVQMAGSEEQLFKVIEDLIARAKRERGKSAAR